MFRRILLFVLATMFWVAHAQETTIVVDCKIPGQLSSYIGESNMASVRSLTLLGTINESDLSTIGSMVRNYNLHDKIDLTDVEIVGITGSYSLTYKRFYDSDKYGKAGKVGYFATPKSIPLDWHYYCIDWVDVDTLVAGGADSDFYTGGCFSKLGFPVKCLIIREGTESISIYGGTTPGYGDGPRLNYTLTSIYLPLSLKVIDCIGNCMALETLRLPQNIKEINNITNCISLTSLDLPEGIEKLGVLSNCSVSFNSDTLFIPASVKYFDTRWASYDGYNGIDQYSGRIKCIYAPPGLETFNSPNENSRGSLKYKNVDVHFRNTNLNYRFERNYLEGSIMYVPAGCNYSTNGVAVFEEVYAQDITITVPEIIYVDEEYELTTAFVPSNTTFQEVNWKLGNEGVAKIDGNGKLKADKLGKFIIYATSADRSCVSSKEISVYEHTTGVELNRRELSMRVGECVNLEAVTLPLNVSDGRVTWESSDSTVARINANGEIEAISYGRCTLTAKSVDGGYSATCSVLVIRPVESVSLENHNITLTSGQRYWLYASILPSNADNKKLNWTSADEGIVEVDSNGVILARDGGYTFVTATSDDNPDAYDVCMVVVRKIEGDVDSNGRVDIDDVNCIINVILGLESNERVVNNADINNSGRADVDDLNHVINLILK